MLTAGFQRLLLEIKKRKKKKKVLVSLSRAALGVPRMAGDSGPEQIQSLVAVGHAIERARNLAGAGKGAGNKGKSSKRLGGKSITARWADLGWSYRDEEQRPLRHSNSVLVLTLRSTVSVASLSSRQRLDISCLHFTE